MRKTCLLLVGILILCTVWTSRSFAQGAEAVQAQPTPVGQLVDAGGHVIFPDSTVEQAIRELLSIPEGPVTPKQMSRLGANGAQLNITAPSPKTVDLSILQLCPKLKELYLEKVTPTSLSEITAIQSLKYFGAKQIQIVDLNFLIGIRGLSDVWISDCPCKDISAVAEMPKLINFSIDTAVSDLSPLYGCKRLVAVAVARLSDTDVNKLLDHLGSQMVELGLNTCTVTAATLDRIAGLKLRAIMLDNVPLLTLEPLWTMRSLRDIALYNLRNKSLEGIQDSKNLRSIRLQGMEKLSDYSPIFQQPNLRTLRIISAEAPNLQGIQNAKKLEELSLEAIDGTVDLTPVFALPTLKRLTLNTVRINTLAGIEGMHALTDLELYSVMGIEDFSPLSGLRKIQRIATDMPERMPEGLPLR